MLQRCQEGYNYICDFDLNSINKINDINKLTGLMNKILFINEIRDNKIERKKNKIIHKIQERQKEIPIFQAFAKNCLIGKTYLADILKEMESIITLLDGITPSRVAHWKETVRISSFERIEDHWRDKTLTYNELKDILQLFRTNVQNQGNHLYKEHMSGWYEEAYKFKIETFEFRGKSFPMSDWNLVVLQPILDRLSNRILEISALIK